MPCIDSGTNEAIKVHDTIPDMTKTNPLKGRRVDATVENKINSAAEIRDDPSPQGTKPGLHVPDFKILYCNWNISDLYCQISFQSGKAQAAGGTIHFISDFTDMDSNVSGKILDYFEFTQENHLWP